MDRYNISNNNTNNTQIIDRVNKFKQELKIAKINFRIKELKRRISKRDV